MADEPVSALDVSIQAQILNLLRALQCDHRIAMLFITHDLAVVERIADKIAVMFGGKIVEEGDPEQVLSRPVHPYTKRLAAAASRIR